MKKSEVVKSNELVQASYTLSLIEQRLILLAIVEARETGLGIDAQLPLTVNAAVYAAQFAVSLDAAYAALSSAVSTLFERQVTFYDHHPQTGQVRRNKTRWVSKVSYVEGAGLVQLIFAPDIVPEITRLEINFTKYDLEQIAGLHSAYAVRLYELLIQWRSVGKTPRVELAQLRNQLGLYEDEYQRMHHFKVRVLDLAVTQINQHTHLHVSYEQHKQGREIVGFTFVFVVRGGVSSTTATTAVTPVRRVKSVPTEWDQWDRLHELELQSCRQWWPELCREQVEAQARAQGLSSLQMMQRLQVEGRRNMS